MPKPQAHQVGPLSPPLPFSLSSPLPAPRSLLFAILSLARLDEIAAAVDEESPDAADVFVAAQHFAQLAVTRHGQVGVEEPEFINDELGLSARQFLRQLLT